MFGLWTMVAAFVGGGTPVPEAPAPELRLAEALRVEQQWSPRLEHMGLDQRWRFERNASEEVRALARLGLGGDPAAPAVDNILIALIDVLVMEQLGLPPVSRVLGTLAGCDPMAVTLSRVCVGGVCLGNAQTLRRVCDDVVVDGAVELVSGTVELVGDDAVLGEGPSDRLLDAAF